MAGLSSSSEIAPPAGQGGLVSSRRHFAMIAWLRWRLFVNSLRGKGAAGELVVKIISYPLLGLMILGPAVGSGFGSWYFVHEGSVRLLAIPLWIIFALWQLIGMNTSATGPSFDLSSLIRYPIRYRDYLLIRLSFGLLDPPTLSGIACLAAMSIGIAVADVSLFPAAALVLTVYAACNVFFSRMVYSWLERWLAQRRTRELVTGVLIGISISIQFLAQYAQGLGHRGHRPALSPWLMELLRTLRFVNWFLPPGLSASALEHVHLGSLPIAAAALGGLLAYTALFLAVLHVRLYGEYRGESLSEAPAGGKPSSSRVKPRPAKLQDRAASSLALRWLPVPVAICLVKEIRYLLRSGPKLYALIMPVFIVFLFSVRSSGMDYSGMGDHRVKGMLFAYGCAYMQMIFVALIYNSMGSDGAGVQFYFLAPVRMREVMLAKNLMVFALFALEAGLIYISSAWIAARSPLDLTAAVLAWSLFTLFANMSIGNLRSIVAPKGIDPSRVRSQNVSGLSSLISLAVVAVFVGLGSGMFFLCREFQIGYWLAAAAFAVLAVGTFLIYVAVLSRIDGIAARHVEDLTRELSRT